MKFQKTKVLNHAKLWEIAKTHQEFTIYDLSDAGKRSTSFVHAAIKDWLYWGYVKAAGKRGNRKLFAVTQKAGTPPTTAQSGRIMSDITPQESMWFVIRNAGVFDYRDIAMQANNEEVRVSEEQASEFCRMLANAGYLKVERKADGKGRLAMYRLVKNTGPKPPRERRIRAVFDDNVGDFTYVARGLK